MELSPRINPEQPTGLDYYVLNEPGERFPKFDPHKQPCMEPRPADDAVFLQGLLEAMSKTEAIGYRFANSQHNNQLFKFSKKALLAFGESGWELPPGIGNEAQGHRATTARGSHGAPA